MTIKQLAEQLVEAEGVLHAFEADLGSERWQREYDRLLNMRINIERKIEVHEKYKQDLPSLVLAARDKVRELKLQLEIETNPALRELQRLKDRVAQLEKDLGKQ